jgi:tetratricopeptide (TPR) repeat protein
LAAIVEDALPEFEASGNEFGLLSCYRGRSQVAHMRARMDEVLEALEQADAQVRRLDLPHLGEWLRGGRGASRLFGSTPVLELLAWLDEQEQHGIQHPSSALHRAQALAMIGEFAEARAILAELRAQLTDRGSTILLALLTGHVAVDVELLAGDPAAAAELAEEGCRLLAQAGDQSWLSTVLGKLAQAQYQLDRLDKAMGSAARAAELGASDDAVTQMLWRQVTAKVLARRGEPIEAERLAREAIAIGAETHMLDCFGDAHADLAEVLILGGRTNEAQLALQHALALYERKGNLTLAARARTRLASLTPA